jgi:hypothetical protein
MWDLVARRVLNHGLDVRAPKRRRDLSHHLQGAARRVTAEVERLSAHILALACRTSVM